MSGGPVVNKKAVVAMIYAGHPGTTYAVSTGGMKAALRTYLGDCGIKTAVDSTMEALVGLIP